MQHRLQTQFFLCTTLRFFPVRSVLQAFSSQLILVLLFNTLFFKSHAQPDTLYIVPVVFHVIHNYGPENISDAQLYDAVNVLNKNFRKQHADTASIVNAFKSIAADCSIEFRLAQKDPDGNCHKGINRMASELTHTGDHAVKTLIHWPRDKYLNIYVCAQAAGLAGHALMPDQADSIPGWDGIVIQHSYVGSIGTSNPLKSMVLTHETGHYLGLQHIWGGNNVPGFYYLPVAQAANCNYSDSIADTPPTIGWQSCNTNGSTCGTLDNVQNFMDYSYCGLMFTEGQKQRMRTILNSSLSQRNNLIQPSNLAATGTDGPSLLCQADFGASKRLVCEGDTVSFNNSSYHGATSFSWSFPGGNPAISNAENPIVVYNSPGQYPVMLTAGNGVDSVSKILSNFISVLPSQGISIPFSEGFENVQSIPDPKWFVNNPDSGITWQADSFASGAKCLKLDNYNNAPGRTDELMSSTVDLSAISEVTLSFDYAYARKSPSNNENIKIWVSANCGKTLSLRKAIGGANLSTIADTIAVPFIPQSAMEWKKVEVTNITSAYFVPDFRFKISFTSDGGNNIFIDNIQINNYPAGVYSMEKNDDFKIYPNPVENKINFSIYAEKSSDAIAYLKDISGRIIAEIYRGRFTRGINSLTCQQTISAGTYFMEIHTDQGITTRKIIIE